VSRMRKLGSRPRSGFKAVDELRYVLFGNRQCYFFS
jgi:hypothetical protein